MIKWNLSEEKYLVLNLFATKLEYYILNKNFLLNIKEHKLFFFIRVKLKVVS